MAGNASSPQGLGRGDGGLKNSIYPEKAPEGFQDMKWPEMLPVPRALGGEMRD